MLFGLFVLKGQINIHHRIAFKQFGVDIGKFFEVIMMKGGQGRLIRIR